MNDMTDSLWLTIDLDPGTAAFFGLPIRLSIPDEHQDPFLDGFDTQASLPQLADALKAAVEKNPDLPDLLQIQGFLHRWPAYADLNRFLRMGNVTFAGKVADSLLEKDALDPPALTAKAMLAAQAGNWEHAVSLLERVLERAPTHGISQLQFALCLSGAGKKKKALDHLKILSRHPSLQSMARFWRHELGTGDPETLSDLLTHALKSQAGIHSEDEDSGAEALATQFPRNPEVLYSRALRPGGCQDDAERETVLQAALAGDPEHTPARVTLAALWRGKGQADDALELLDGGLETSPGDPALLAARGQTLEQLGRRAEALVAYETLFEVPLSKIPGPALVLGGQGLIRLGDARRARTLFAETAQARPGDPLPHQLLARLDEISGVGFAGAERRLREAVRACGPMPMLQYALGDLLRRAGRTAEAEGLFKVLARRHPRSPWGHRGLGDLRVEEKPAEAVSHYATALEHSPGIPIPGYDYLQGVAALRAGDLQNARNYLKRAVAGEPDNARYWCDLGAASFFAGDLPGAILATERALGLKPDHPGFLHNMAQYHLARFRKRPWAGVGDLWRFWLLKRRVSRAGKRGWRKDLWAGQPDPDRDSSPGPPPA